VILTPVPIDGAFVVALEPRIDARGSFARAFCKREFIAAGITFDVVQANLAVTARAGTVRGLHYQQPPAQESKLVRCLRGAVYDVLVDMRPASRSYRAVFSQRLDADNRLALFVPAGVAHGYQALADDTEFMYLTDQYYAPGEERGVRFDDPRAAIAWPLPPRDVAERDRAWPDLPATGAAQR
jgi:dTDP-4-dehydrorhamnose 3,5-epimerase